MKKVTRVYAVQSSGKEIDEATVEIELAGNIVSGYDLRMVTITSRAKETIAVSDISALESLHTLLGNIIEDDRKKTHGTFSFFNNKQARVQGDEE